MRENLGFSIIEFTMVILVIGILAAAVAPWASMSVRSFDTISDDVIALDRVRYATERLAREFREMKRDTSTGQFVATIPMSSTAPSFTKLEDGYTSVVVTVGQSGGNVTLAYDTVSASPTPVLTDLLTTLTFTYYKDDETAFTPTTTDDLLALRYVGVSMTLTQNSLTYSHQVRVKLRNR